MFNSMFNSSTFLLHYVIFDRNLIMLSNIVGIPVTGSLLTIFTIAVDLYLSITFICGTEEERSDAGSLPFG